MLSVSQTLSATLCNKVHYCFKSTFINVTKTKLDWIFYILWTSAMLLSLQATVHLYFLTVHLETEVIFAAESLPTKHCDVLLTAAGSLP